MGYYQETVDIPWCQSCHDPYVERGFSQKNVFEDLIDITCETWGLSNVGNIPE